MKILMIFHCMRIAQPKMKIQSPLYTTEIMMRKKHTLHNIKIDTGKKVIESNFPSSFEELSRNDFIFLSKYITQEQPKETDQILMMNYFLNTGSEPLFDFPPELTALLVQLFDSEPSGKWFINHYEDLTGPLDYFRNICFAEFAFLDTYFMRYFETNDISFLDKGIASIYRYQNESFNPDEEIDSRELFNEVKIPFYQSIVANFPVKIKLAILLNYKMFREWLKKPYPMVFEKEHEERSSSGSGWDKVIRQMCHNDLTKLNEVKFLLIHNVFAEMNDQLLIAAKYKRK